MYDELHCPFCGSTNIYDRKEDFNFEAAFWWMIFFHLLGGFLAGLLSHKKVKCHYNDCGCDFILYG